MADSKGGCWRSVAVLTLVLLLGSSFAFAETDKVIVKTSRRNKEATTVDVGPAVPQSDGYGSNYEIAGMHGWVLGCNNDEPSCYMPHAEDSGYLVEGSKQDKIYDGENVKIRWANNSVGLYFLRETY